MKRYKITYWPKSFQIKRYNMKLSYEIAAKNYKEAMGITAMGRAGQSNSDGCLIEEIK